MCERWRCPRAAAAATPHRLLAGAVSFHHQCSNSGRLGGGGAGRAGGLGHERARGAGQRGGCGRQTTGPSDGRKYTRKKPARRLVSHWVPVAHSAKSATGCRFLTRSMWSRVCKRPKERMPVNPSRCLAAPAHIPYESTAAPCGTADPRGYGLLSRPLGISRSANPGYHCECGWVVNGEVGSNVAQEADLTHSHGCCRLARARCTPAARALVAILWPPPRFVR